ncbi:Dedicator of cytokinesis protein 9 [Acropora cervicornis]|uniref:Dedicator of cytokinesis protein 9 n=1 Tax=Acropora cervicornis TaxID=6130 RepID=A0AAD9VGA5_ACRCE|nr:Dedicator of cytokinesis protein 9 [Acropora cervicornis]
MEDFVRVSYKDTSLLTVPTSVSFTKARSYSDTSIFKAISEKNRTSTQTGDDSYLTLPPSPSLKSAVSFEAPVETEVSKPKRKTSRPRSPFSPERALDLLSKWTKNEFVSKVTSSPKLLPRRTRSKAKAESENRESEVVTGILPISYEDEIVQKRTQILRDPLQALLVFPEDDVKAFTIPRELRTLQSTVPHDALSKVSNLFTCEAVPMSPLREKGINKQGYLTKAPFHGESNGTPGAKNFKRRWFHLKQISNDGSYVLEYKKLYSLIADSQSEMDSWIAALGKVTGIDMDSGGKTSNFSVIGKLKGPKVHQSLRESLKSSKHPELVEFAKETEVLNAKKRRDGRKKLFSLVHDLDNNGTCVNYDDARIDANVYQEHFGMRVVVECEDLKFRLLRTIGNGNEVNVEPFFISMSLFDAKKGLKISEDFHCDLNDASTTEMLRGSELIENGHANGSRKFYKAASALVLNLTSSQATPKKPPKRRISGLKSAAKASDSMECRLDGQRAKTASEIKKTVERKTKYQRILVNSQNTAQSKDTFRNKETGESCRKYERMLVNSRNTAQSKARFRNKEIGEIKRRYKCVQISIKSYKEGITNCLTSSLVPVKPWDDSYGVVRSTVEVEEFCQSCPEAAHPHTAYVNNLYCIYKKKGSPGFTTHAYAAVLHHCTNPTFYEEKHHVFFTFQHIACEQTKTNIGYAWMPVLHGTLVKTEESNLLVGQTAPHGYLNAFYGGMKKTTGPELKWVDKEKPLFKVCTKLVSTVNTKDPEVDNFFRHCQKFDDTPSTDIEMVKLLKVLNGVNVITVARFLPVILNQLFHILVVTSNEDVSLNVYVFVTELAVDNSKTIHEQLSKYLMTNLKPGADPVVVNDLMKLSWFFFEIIVKSMAQTLVQSDKLKRMNRESWFADSYNRCLENFLQAFVPQIINRLKDQPQIAKEANFHLACFTKGRHIRRLAIRVLRNMLVKHELDDRYEGEQKQARICTLYLPLLSVLLDHAPRFHGSKYDLSNQTFQTQTSHASSVMAVPNNEFSPDSNRSSSYSVMKQSPSDSLTPQSAQPLREATQIALQRPHWHPTLLCLVQQDKNFAKFAAIIDVFDLLEYQGKEKIVSQSTNSETTKQFLEQKYQGGVSNHGKTRHSRAASSGGLNMDIQTRVLLEGNLANEVGLIVLDTIELFCGHFKFQLEQDEGDNIMMKKIPQSEFMMRHVFASLRSYINKILSCCNSKLNSLRNQACSFLYLLMRSNFEFSGAQGCDRVHWQVIVAVSKLMANGLNRTAEHDDVPEVLVDLQYSLAKSYSSTPELRETWLEHMAAVHESHENYSETAHCYIHAAALVAEYLKRQGVYPPGCAAFAPVSPNVVADESVMKTDEGMTMEQRYTVRHLVDLLEQCAKYLERAERYEVMGERLSIAYESLAQAYKKVVEVMGSGRRLLGKYFRVAFFGQMFGDDDGKEFIYKEPKITGLAEISQRLEQIYSKKHGKERIKLIMESAKVHPETLGSRKGYIQITYVQPYFDDEEMQARPTLFERNNNIRRFIYETPFTCSGKAHGNLTEQCKRKTILTTSNTFPYIKKRILVVQEEQYELTPVEVAFDEMQNKVKELNNVITQTPPDMKKLQLVDFIACCGKALDINDQLIKEDQRMYQEDMKEKYNQLKTRLAKYIGDEPNIRNFLKLVLGWNGGVVILMKISQGNFGSYAIANNSCVEVVLGTLLLSMVKCEWKLSQFHLTSLEAI